VSPGWDREGSSTGAYFEAVTRNKSPRQFRTNCGDRFFIRHFWNTLREQANRSIDIATRDRRLGSLTADQSTGENRRVRQTSDGVFSANAALPQN